MKICSKCEQIKELTEFSKSSTFKDGYQYQCKQCKKDPGYDKTYYNANKEKRNLIHKQYILNNKEHLKQYARQYNKSFILPYHIVYLLPDHNYVGVTNNTINRMNWHKSVHNRSIGNWVELARFDNRKDAEKYEATKHAEGYDGAKQVISRVCAKT